MSTATKNALENFEAINYDPAVHKWSDVSTLKLPFESIRYDFDSHKLEVRRRARKPLMALAA